MDKVAPGLGNPGGAGQSFLSENLETAMSETLAQAAQLMQKRRFGEAEALFRKAAEASESTADAPFGLALALEGQGRLDEAEATYRQALAQRPGFVEAGCNLGSLLLRRERPAEALPFLQAARDAKPDFLPAQINLALACLALGRGADAEAACREALRLEPGNLMALNELGRALLQQTKVAEAVAVFEEGHHRRPQDPRFLANLAGAHELANDLAAAQAALDKAMALSPNAPALLFPAAKLARRRGETAAARQALDRMLAQALSQADRSDALLELGQLLDEEGESAEAFTCFLEANALRARSAEAKRFDGDAFLRRVRALRDAPTSTPAESHEDDGAPSPIFFVGFPRSGTSLMEQALGAHPALVTTSERSPLGPIVAELSRRSLYPGPLDPLGDEEITEARAAFWQSAERLVGSLTGRRLVDKTALNIIHLGLIDRLFPQARVLVALRDPRDAVLSCFMQRFQLSETTVNFLDLARTARCYAEVMALWQQDRQRLPLSQQSYRYEDLVEDFDGSLRAVLDFLEVGWHADVLRYREKSTASRVTTPSYHQVTKPLYDSARGRWTRYRDQLAPVLSTLQPFAEVFGYGPNDEPA